MMQNSRKLEKVETIRQCFYSHLLSELHDDGLGSLIKLVLSVLLLLLQRSHNVSVWTFLPVIQTVDLSTNNNTAVRKQQKQVRCT